MYDLTARRFGRLTALFPERTATNKYGWRCRCDCGGEIVVRTPDLMNGHTKSCGCLQRDNCSTHGLSNTALYDTWYNMVSRCHNPKDKSFTNYGGRGITVCKEWMVYECFLKWASENGYQKELTLDREDNARGYSPDNCRFVDTKTQNRNKRNTIRLNHNGVSLTLIEMSEIYHIPYPTIWWRYKHNRDLLSGKKVQVHV